MAKILYMPDQDVLMLSVRRAASEQSSNKDAKVKALVDATMDRFNSQKKEIVTVPPYITA